MDFAFITETVLESLAVLFVIWGFFHEDRLIAFENRIFSRLRRRRLHIVKPDPRVE